MFGLMALVDILLDLLRGADINFAILLFIATASPVRLLKRVRLIQRHALWLADRFTLEERAAVSVTPFSIKQSTATHC